MELTFSESGPPVDDHQLDELERARGVRLPPAYREFLKERNGGEILPAVFRVQGGEESAVDGFLIVGSVRMDSAWNTLKWPNSPELPAEYIPIAMCIGGDYLCMAVDGPNTGQIRFWDHEEGVEEGQTPTEEQLYVVADDLGSFLAGLFPEE